jgi:hypothetical protein
MRALTLRAEVVLGGLLVGRHRTFRLSLALVLALIVVAGSARGGAVSTHTVLVAAGTLGAVAGARLMAPGAPLESVRRVGATWWVPPVGRVTGSALFLAPVVGAGALALVWPAEEWAAAASCAALAWGYGATWAGCALALAPFLGASPAAALGVLAVWLGGIPPSAVHELLQGTAYLQRPAVWLWNVLPLGWRADRALAGSVPDGALLGAWLVVGLVVAGWASSLPRRDVRRWGDGP